MNKEEVIKAVMDKLLEFNNDVTSEFMKIGMDIKNPKMKEAYDRLSKKFAEEVVDLVEKKANVRLL